MTGEIFYGGGRGGGKTIEAELRRRIAELELEVSRLKGELAKRNASVTPVTPVTPSVTPVTPSVTPSVTPRNANAERQRRYRERRKGGASE